MSTQRHCDKGDGGWLTAYKAANEDRLRTEPEFAAWLEDEYVPIAGGWQY
jgi:hypothetical protein